MDLMEILKWVGPKVVAVSIGVGVALASNEYNNPSVDDFQLQQPQVVVRFDECEQGQLECEKNSMLRFKDIHFQP